MLSDGSPVLKITVKHLTTQIKNLARQIAADEPQPRTSEQSTSHFYGDDIIGK